MEKGKFFSNVASSPPSLSYGAASSSLGMEGQVLGESNCSSEQLPNCFLNLSVPFESALSSIVSSPVASNATVPSDSIAIRELIGRLGGDICNSREMSPQSYQTLGCSEASYIGGGNNISTNKSCYSTPFNSPPKLNLGLMDHHQAKGNLPISANSMSIYPSLATYSADPGFVERAAKFSCFGNQSFGGLTGQFGLNESEFPYRSMPMMENGQLLRVSSSQSFKTAGSQMGGSPKNRDGIPLQDGFETEMRSASASASVSASDRKFCGFSRSSTPDNAEFANVHEKSSASEQIPGGDAGLKSPSSVNPIKRKAVPKGKAKDLPSSPSAKDSKIAAEDEDSNSKRHKLYETNGNDKDEVKAKVEANENSIPAKDHKQNKDNSKPPEPPKDYIHVRARRGQATDSHSLAERVRREKISERMKLLQDLVPGCNKVTGKAVMLDEIINYVQSLQRQVEFLSMKLATVNPRLDFNIETLLSKDILQMRGSLPHTVYPLDSSSSVFPYGHHPQQGPPLQSSISDGLETQCSVNPLDPSLCRNLSMQLPPADGFGEAASQVAIFWEDDLQSIVQMSFGQNQSQETTFLPESFHGSVPTAHMKVEL